MDKDLEYFTRRAREERAAAASSPNSGIAALHAELADRYDALLRAANRARGQAA